MRIACWIPKATNTHSGYVILPAFQLQHWLQERAKTLPSTYVACLVLFSVDKIPGYVRLLINPVVSLSFAALILTVANAWRALGIP